MAHSTNSSPLHIYGITVDFSKSRTNVESAEVQISKLPHSPMEHEAGKSWRRTFSPPIELSHEDTFSLHMRYKTWFGMKTEYEDIVFNLDDMFRVYSASDRQEYNKFHKNIRIVVDLSGNTTTELGPTTSEIFRKCPRFRILVVGKTGVGKSSLINHAFGVEKTAISHDKPGKASIDHEFISLQNDRFVLHDSKGFEPGEEDNVKIVRDFIDRRRKSALEHQLHAVWLCFEIPRAGGRLLETGTEAFLTLKNNGALGNIPVIVVLTKYDMLIDRMERTLDGISVNGLSDKAIKELAKNKAEAGLQDICIGPLEKFAGPDIPHVKTSTHKDHKETLTHLIQITEKCVGLHSTPEAAVMASIAQRVHPGLKIEASIEVGKRRYWKALASSTIFKTHKTWDCLHVLHTDIVNVWNFYDPHHYLHSQEFRELMVKIAVNLEVAPTPNLANTIPAGLSMVGIIAGIVSILVEPAAPIVVPIAASAALAKWVWDVYQTSHAVLQYFMSYIIHLTLVLQTLYLVSESQELTRRAIKLAVASYLTTPMSGEVHTRIREYNKQLTILERVDRDILDKIFEVMQFYSIDAAEMSKLREKIPHVGLLPDEPWETRNS
jgi:GTP-binding protein EngB required for normal cell division